MGQFTIVVLLCFTLCVLIDLVTNQFANTRMGPIEGKFVFFDRTRVQAFLGIPYAKPPVGKLRFRKPEPVEPWNDVLSAKSLSAPCVQVIPAPFPWLDTKPDKQEDCLYLNIWAPVNASCKNRKAVMFWVHGGGFLFGYGGLDIFDGRVLVALGDVIVVTINYRVGPQGFIDSGTDEAPGNMGLYDILEALKWVHSNIKAFGGDRNLITVFGQSCGAIAAGMIAVSPLSKRLFRRLILESGSPTNLDAENNTRDFNLTEELAKEVGCIPDGITLESNPEIVMECMRDIDGFTLANISYKLSSNSQREFYPKYGDEILPENARKIILKGDFPNRDVLMGVNTGEGATLITKTRRQEFGFFGHRVSELNRTRGEAIIRENFKSFQDPEAVVEQYLGKLEEDDYEAILYQVHTSVGDYSRFCPSVYFADSFARKGSRVFFYLFAHRPVLSPFASWMRAVHRDEIPFVFGVPFRKPFNYTGPEQYLSKKLLNIWTSFAKTGYPVCKSWPLYSAKKPYYRIFDTTCARFGKGPHKENCDFFRPYFEF